MDADMHVSVVIDSLRDGLSRREDLFKDLTESRVHVACELRGDGSVLKYVTEPQEKHNAEI
jgi:hypothetical protein